MPSASVLDERIFGNNCLFEEAPLLFLISHMTILPIEFGNESYRYTVRMQNRKGLPRVFPWRGGRWNVHRSPVHTDQYCLLYSYYSELLLLLSHMPSWSQTILSSASKIVMQKIDLLVTKIRSQISSIDPCSTPSFPGTDSKRKRRSATELEQLSSIFNIRRWDFEFNSIQYLKANTVSILGDTHSWFGSSLPALSFHCPTAIKTAFRDTSFYRHQHEVSWNFRSSFAGGACAMHSDHGDLWFPL